MGLGPALSISYFVDFVLICFLVIGFAAVAAAVLVVAVVVSSDLCRQRDWNRHQKYLPVVVGAAGLHWTQTLQSRCWFVAAQAGWSYQRVRGLTAAEAGFAGVIVKMEKAQFLAECSQYCFQSCYFLVATQRTQCLT